MEKEVKEIVIKQNTGIIFPKGEENGDILILGNFNGICGEVKWEGVDNSTFDTDNFLKYRETFETNIGVILNTLRAGNRIIIAASKETIDYFQKLLYTIADWFMSDMSGKARKKMFNRQVWTIDTTELYERTYVKYESNSEYRKELAKKAIDNIVTNKIFEKIQHMKFDYIIQNPPYNGSLHLDFLEKGLDLLTEKGRMVIIEPATWLINIRKNGKAKKYDAIKKRIEGHVESVKIENFNKEFNTNLFMPFAITTIDFSKTFDEIEFICCGEKKVVKSIYDCNLVGDYSTVWGIIEKCQKFGDMMKNHITKENMGEGMFYSKFAELDALPLCQTESGRVGRSYEKSEGMFQEHKFGKYCTKYSTISYHYYQNGVSDTPFLSYGKDKKLTDKIADNIYGTRQELENWKHFIFSNKLPLFLNIALTIDQHNNSKEFLPWLVDKQYTDEEINKLFGFTDEEIALIDRTIKKYERNSPWFKRYMCGPDSVSDEEVNNFINNL